MGGGGGAEVIYLNWCWGGGGQVFWVDRIAPSKKIKTSTICGRFQDGSPHLHAVNNYQHIPDLHITNTQIHLLCTG